MGVVEFEDDDRKLIRSSISLTGVCVKHERIGNETEKDKGNGFWIERLKINNLKRV